MYKNNLIELKDKYHPECMFNTDIFNFNISFNNDGELTCHFCFDEKYQSYSGRL